MFVLILALVFLSGLTGLVYQVTWQKYLSIFLGSHAFATALVLGVFFLFLSIGYFAAGRYASSSRLMKNKLLLYGVVELFIGLYALVSPNIFHFLNDVLSIHTESEFTTVALGLTFASLFIGLPTFLMGATIPVLTLGLSKSAVESHRTHALIYGVNTIGAFAGCLLAGFWMIEAFGLPLTIMYTGLVNILIFVGTSVIARRAPDSFAGCPPAVDSPAAATPSSSSSVASSMTHSIAYIISFLSGFYVFALENLLIRMAGFAIGSSTYTYTIVVSAFILAIGLGSLFVAKLEKWSPQVTLLGSQIALLVSGVVTYLLIPHWPELFLRIRLLIQPAHMNFYFYWFFMFILFLIVLVPFVFFMGMNLPLLFGQLRFTNSLNAVAGRLYSVNCMGSFLGAIIGGYLLFNYFDADTIFKFTCLCVAGSSILLLQQSTFRKRAQWSYFYYGATSIFTIFLITLPHWQPSNFTPAMYYLPNLDFKSKSYFDILSQVRIDKKKYNFVASYADPSTQVDIVDADGARVLFLNGKPDAVTNVDATTRALAALIPISISPNDIKNVFIVGLGAGLSTSIAAQFSEIQNIDVAEISSGVIRALPLFDSYNTNLTARQNKYTLFNGDAYKVLKDSKKTYSIIISEPTHLWVSGVEKLFTYDFYQIAKSKLSERGLYVQWMPTFNLDAKTFLMLLNGFTQNFNYTTVWSTKGGAIALIGSEKPLTLDSSRLQKRFIENTQIYNTVGLKNAYSILSLQMLSSFASANLLVHEQRLHTLENPALEFESGRTFFANTKTNLDELVNPFNETLAYHKTAQNSFLYENVWAQMSANSIQEGLALAGYKFHQDHLGHLLYLKKGSSAYPSLSKQGLEIFKALETGDTSRLPDMTQSESIQVLSESIKTYYASYRPINFDFLKKIFDPLCKNKQCLEAKLKIVSSSARTKFRVQADYILKNPNWISKEINALYDESFSIRE